MSGYGSFEMIEDIGLILPVSLGDGKHALDESQAASALAAKAAFPPEHGPRPRSELDALVDSLVVIAIEYQSGNPEKKKMGLPEFHGYPTKRGIEPRLIFHSR